MKVKLDKPTEGEIKDIADRAEGLKPAERERPGRPTAYQASFVEQAKKLCALGATDAEMAGFFEVAVSTFYKWKSEFPEFSEAIKNAKAIADERVERSLYHRAVGYTFESEKVFQFQGQIVRTPTKEHVPPDTTAAIFWLKNRRSKEWRDVRQHEIGQPGDFERLSDEELLEALSAEAKEIGLSVPKPKTNGRATH